MDSDWQIRMAIRYIGSGMLTGVEKALKAAKNVPVVETIPSLPSLVKNGDL